jgi:hypothetical protein
MGSSYTEFRGKGFWSRDHLLEAWLRTLTLQMGDDVYQPGWQHELRDYWWSISGGCFQGCIWASLDDFLADGDRVAFILRASERSIESLRAFGPYVPAAFLNAIGLSSGTDWPIQWFERIADHFNALLRGELSTDASTGPVLPATRKGQRWDEIEQPRQAQTAPPRSPE